MKSIMLSIKPKRLVEILNGNLLVEIRKTMPSELPCLVYLYCTKSGSLLKFNSSTNKYYLFDENNPPLNTPIRASLNGKVVGNFLLNECEVCDLSQSVVRKDEIIHRVATLNGKSTCLTWEQLWNYANGNPRVCAWHIDRLKIFYKPKELEIFNLKKPTQSWCYCSR